MENKITSLFKNKEQGILNVYVTAGYPHLESTIDVVLALEKAGVDIVELGMPYSDPLADGETIQNSSQIALKNGMHLDLLFKQVKEIRSRSKIPLVLMGYYNQMIQYGIDQFLATCQSHKIDSLIIPDLPVEIYEKHHREQFKKYGMSMCFLITPETSDERIVKMDEMTNGFVYVVSQSSITGKTADISKQQITYFEKIKNYDFKNPTLIGFGIHDKKSFDQACKYANGAIIGSAFIKALGKSMEEFSSEGSGPFIDDIVRDFIDKIK